ncbi:MAG: TlpA family protein disulfide reductase [Gemmatimonadetes bacterium]|nr:TlpA family protein disulfide reductase [Gemmatimonadota bacterium]
MRRLVSAGGIAAVLLFSLPLAGQGESGIPLGTPAPVVSVNDLDGKAVDLGQWVGKKPVLIEFWATWCSNCEELLPRFVAAHREFGDRVEFLGVNVTVNQTPERVRRYLAQHTVPFRILYDDRGASTRAYQAPATSFVVILDAAGRVIYTGVGADQRFEPALKQVAGVKE